MPLAITSPLIPPEPPPAPAPLAEASTISEWIIYLVGALFLVIIMLLIITLLLVVGTRRF
ncbi:hypothetical protein ACFLW6_00185 [Chloroflexota bacterium]